MPNYNPREHINGLSDDDAQQGECEVVSPAHYTVGGYEALDIIRAKLTPEEYRGYCKGNVLKYVMRSNYKGHHDTDCRKAEFYGRELVSSLRHREVQHGTEAEGLHDDIPF